MRFRSTSVLALNKEEYLHVSNKYKLTTLSLTFISKGTRRT